MQSVQFKHADISVRLFTHDAPDHLHNVLSASTCFYESDLLAKAAELYECGSWIIDVGANIGNHTIFFSKVLGAKVLAFEPFDKSRTILQKNIWENDCSDLVRVEASALGALTGRGSVTSSAPGNYGTVRIDASPAGNIDLGRLDEFVTVDMSVRIIKIDVEGSELAVLKGAAKTLAYMKPHLFVEAAEPAALQGLQAYLEPYGYCVNGQYCATPTYLFSATGL